MKQCAAALLLLLLACHGATEQRGPDALYADGRAAIEHGDYDVAERIAREGQAEFARDAQSRELFATLEAEAVGRKDPKAALAILDRTPATGAALPAVRRLIARAYALDNSGKPKEADTTYAAAEALATRVAPTEIPEITMRRVAPMVHLGEDAAAARFAQRAIEIAAARQTWVLASAYGSLGLVEARQKHWRQAKEHLALGVRYAHAAQAKAAEAIHAGNLGWVALELGDLDEALPLLRSALALAEQQQLLWQQHVALTHIANVYESRMEPANALPYAKRALAVARKLDDRSVANSLGQLATINLELRNMKDAVAQSAEALAIREKMRADVLHSRLLDARIAAATGNPAHAVEMLESIVASRDADAPMRWRAQAIKAKIYAQQLGRLDEAEQMYEATLKTGDEAREKVHGSDAFAFERNLFGTYDEYIDLLLLQGRTADALRVAERSRARTLREAIRLDPRVSVDPPAIARAKNVTILCYWLGAERSLLWTVTPRGVTVTRLPPGDDIDQKADAYRDELQSSRPSLSSRLGAALYAMLVEPANIAPASRVIVLPAGHLNALSFETLIAPSPRPHYWIEDVTVSYSPSLQILASSPSWHGVRDPRLLALGDVPAQGREFPELTRAGEEISQVAAYFDPSRRVVIARSTATPAAYAAADPKRFNFIHFAAHATASTRTPLDSAVILAAGRLSGADIVRVPLVAELVTVSSCNSAGRRSYAGEGLVGLAWAFLGAGAHRVVAAQWEVVDSATPRIMNGMYDGITHGLDPAEALRRAKLSLLHSNTVYQSPSYWAPFAVYGAV